MAGRTEGLMMQTTYTLNELIMAITIDDVVNQAEAFGLTEDEVRDRQRAFEKALSWGVMDYVWDAINDTLQDIAIELGKEPNDA